MIKLKNSSESILKLTTLISRENGRSPFNDLRYFSDNFFVCFVWTVSSCQLLFQLVLHFSCRECFEHLKVWFEYEDYDSNWKTTIRIWRLRFKCEDFDSKTKTIIQIRWLQFEYEDYDSNAKTTIWIWRLQSEYEDYNSNMNTKFRIW